MLPGSQKPSGAANFARARLALAMRAGVLPGFQLGPDPAAQWRAVSSFIANAAKNAGYGGQATQWMRLGLLRGGQPPTRQPAAPAFNFPTPEPNANYPRYSGGTPTPGVGVGGPLMAEGAENPTGLPLGEMIQPTQAWAGTNPGQATPIVPVNLRAAGKPSPRALMAAARMAHANNTPY